MGVRNDTLDLTLEAEQIFSPDHCARSEKERNQWELKLIDTAANRFTTCYLLGTVSAKHHAIEALLTAMETVNHYKWEVIPSHRRRIALFRERIRDECPLHPYK
ncbi:hypothetical protein [Haladaptatus pallidirubidus]|uniref:Uncharacterized protein n=1 Tax=Haladaptatus pallidirubidus TaxID=1008152 RepID=A0AAV3UQF3_9EURY|nr:hypothetical protein [Haladaptatus pallidirubidus]